MKMLPQVYFATMLAGKLSKMHQQSFKMFSHLRISSGMAKNGNTSATKIMGQEIMLEVIFMLAGILSSICRQCFRMFSHTRIAFGTAQNAEKSAQNPAKNSFQMLFNILICLKPSWKSPMHSPAPSGKHLFHGCPCWCLPAVLPVWDWHPYVSCTSGKCIIT